MTSRILLAAGLVAVLGGPVFAQAGAPSPAGPAPAGASAPGAAPPAGSPAAAAPSPGGPPPAGAAAAPSGTTGGGAGQADGGAYTVRLRDLENKTNELKEKIYQTKRRLTVLKETVLGGVIGASRALLKHKNEMGNSFRLIKAVYALDGVQIFSKSDDSGRLADMPEFEVYNGAIQPGSHTLTAVLVYQGNGFGVFSYLKGYKFNVRSSHTFIAGEGKATQITVRGYEKGNITTNLQDRPAIEFLVSVMAAEGSGSAKK